MFIIFRIIKLLVDTIIHGYAIYSLYGFSVHLIGAIWNSVTQLLLHLAHQSDKKRNQGKNQEEGEEMKKLKQKDDNQTDPELAIPRVVDRDTI